MHLAEESPGAPQATAWYPTVGWEPDFILSFRVMPWPVAKTNIYPVNVQTDQWLGNLGRCTQSSTRGILRTAACWGVAGLPRDHQSVSKY